MWTAAHGIPFIFIFESQCATQFEIIAKFGAPAESLMGTFSRNTAVILLAHFASAAHVPQTPAGRDNPNPVSPLGCAAASRQNNNHQTEST